MALFHTVLKFLLAGIALYIFALFASPYHPSIVQNVFKSFEAIISVAVIVTYVGFSATVFAVGFITAFLEVLDTQLAIQLALSAVVLLYLDV
ncbi:hypothetical protein BDV95DRAFT_559912 [Massariosphaeria phaeospora]|uniref:Uncharacterized protein n=1 Tax=Massariosphaeria phaeospora TaxID=100035 RepID=A0A7C8MXZ0_9PLEO|nr:hypothetical protein BDV95DRAFT_559912 [Massariosphaeria phaeospora]